MGVYQGKCFCGAVELTVTGDCAILGHPLELSRCIGGLLRLAGAAQHGPQPGYLAVARVAEHDDADGAGGLEVGPGAEEEAGGDAIGAQALVEHRLAALTHDEGAPSLDLDVRLSPRE